jgi:hypothetical protein
VKEASGIGYITTKTDNNTGHINIVIHSATKKSAQIARMLVEINIKEQIKYQLDLQRLHQVSISCLPQNSYLIPAIIIIISYVIIIDARKFI